MFGTIQSWLGDRDRIATVNRAPRPPQLGLEALEVREVPATTAALGADGVLRIVGDYEGSAVSVSRQLTPADTPLSKPTSEVVVTSSDNNGTRTQRFNSFFVNSIEYTGSGWAADTFRNNTSIGSVVNGGGGADKLYGGSGNDTIDGGYGTDAIDAGAGNDTVFGGHDSDVIDGGTGNDTLYGDANTSLSRFIGGNDLIRGGAGNDRLYGEAGDDTLYGQADNDHLYGGAGNDGLFGGSHVDVLDGEGGADRLLVWEPVLSDLAYTFVRGATAEDAVVRFQDGAAGKYKETQHTAGSWTLAEIERVDGALARLHERTGNTVLLERADGSPLIFVRLGGANGQAAAWNSRSTLKLYFPDNPFGGSAAGFQETVLHEVGHNWDEENPRWQEFLRISGWTQTDPRDPTRFTKIEKYDQTWWYRTGSERFSGYAMTHPRDDFAESFAAVLSGDTAEIPRKAALINAWLDGISS